MLEQAILFGTIAVIAGAACTLAEMLRPARPLAYRDVVPRDALAFGIYIGAVYPLALWLSNHCQGHIPVIPPIAGAPLVVRVVLYYLAADLGSYLLHRLMHTRLLWRIHKWHHAPTYMYWFAGVRATVQQQFLFNLPFVVAVPILASAPVWVYQAIAAEVIVRNDWMHMNVTWRSNWLEWILVTPRYHHVHHSADLPAHLGNFGSLFTIWDRVFGTRLDPDVITPTRFGTGTEDNVVRLVVGI
jgi:sterol desaturase/sphingolipid hydroxylase (fatty acid hydroxylase superfamily)